MRTTNVLLIVSVLMGLASLGYAQETATSFTWSGELVDANVPLEGDYDLLFSLFDAPEDGNQLGVDVFRTGVTVVGGFYSDVLDFAVDIFDGQSRWLEIAYRPAGFTSPCRVLWAPRAEVIRTHHTILAEAIAIGRNKPYKKLTVECNSPVDGLWIRAIEEGGEVGALALLGNMRPGGWNRLTQKGDNMLLWKGHGPDDPNVGGLVIAPWSPTGAGIRITPEGNVGIGVKFPAATLEVAGSIRCASLYQSSDERFKGNIAQLGDVLERIGKIRGVSFEWNQKAKSMGVQAGQKQIGVLAQEVESVFPELVASSADGYKSVDYTKLTAVLIEAVKELKTENESLNRRLQTLEVSRDSD